MAEKEKDVSFLTRVIEQRVGTPSRKKRPILLRHTESFLIRLGHVGHPPPPRGKIKLSNKKEKKMNWPYEPNARPFWSLVGATDGLALLPPQNPGGVPGEN